MSQIRWPAVLLGFVVAMLLGFGLGSVARSQAGVENPGTLASLVAYVWRTTPFNILLYHAALQGIPADYYEAAEVDGSSGWTSFWNITLPLLRPIIAVTLILRTTFAFMVFDEILAITQGGPGNDTWVAAWYTYRVSFQPPFNVGLGAASAYVLAFILVLVAIGYVRVVSRRIEY